MTIPPWVWIVWIVIALGGFTILETIALANRQMGDTLSENIRRWFGIHPPSPVKRVAVPIFISALVIFTVWFIPHIVWQLW